MLLLSSGHCSFTLHSQTCLPSPWCSCRCWHSCWWWRGTAGNASLRSRWHQRSADSLQWPPVGTWVKGNRFNSEAWKHLNWETFWHKTRQMSVRGTHYITQQIQNNWCSIKIMWIHCKRSSQKLINVNGVLIMCPCNYLIVTPFYLLSSHSTGFEHVIKYIHRNMIKLF